MIYDLTGPLAVAVTLAAAIAALACVAVHAALRIRRERRR